MNGIKIADVIMSGLIILIITSLIYFAVINLKTEKEQEDISVPHNYHILYDDANNMIIVPKEYHFKYGDDGEVYLTK